MELSELQSCSFCAEQGVWLTEDFAEPDLSAEGLGLGEAAAAPAQFVSMMAIFLASIRSFSH